MHERFCRKVWAFDHDFTGALAKWLVIQSPYIVPENLTICIEKFREEIISIFLFNDAGMVEISLEDLTQRINSILEKIPEIMSLNERKNGREGSGFCSRRDSGQKDPDDDFIDIMAVAQNITCAFAERADAECWLNRNKTSWLERLLHLCSAKRQI
ncbi:MAG: hypothetical protein BA863_01805 [Desulfovibrio sp. S3730MH75]|nr:MAG: hypothetical protein BA863_01805 [Desulfovibrio sp. S3730MH75]